MHAAGSRQQFTPLKPAVELHDYLMQNPRCASADCQNCPSHCVGCVVCNKREPPCRKAVCLELTEYKRNFKHHSMWLKDGLLF